MVPEFVAEGLMLIYMGGLRQLYLRWKLARLQRQAGRGPSDRRVRPGPPVKPAQTATAARSGRVPAPTPSRAFPLGLDPPFTPVRVWEAMRAATGD